MIRTIASVTLASLGISCGHAPAADAAANPKAGSPAPAQPKPTLANVAYGTHLQQVLDCYKAGSDKPTPVVFFTSGGGWLDVDKSGFNNAAPYLAARISGASLDSKGSGI